MWSNVIRGTYAYQLFNSTHLLENSTKRWQYQIKTNFDKSVPMMMFKELEDIKKNLMKNLWINFFGCKGEITKACIWNRNSIGLVGCNRIAFNCAIIVQNISKLWLPFGKEYFIWKIMDEHEIWYEDKMLFYR